MAAKIELKGKIFTKYIKKKDIKQAVQMLANKINEDYKGREIDFIVVLNGAFVFAADLLRQIRCVNSVNFVKLSSYEGLISRGEVSQKIALDSSVKGRDVVVIEDIIETGCTLEHLINELEEQKPQTLELCCLLFKPEKFEKQWDIKYVGRQIDEQFVVGYGMDFDLKGRTLEDIYQLKTKKKSNLKA
jgi:hypoxanthine phosphoribosyltransferase